VKEQAQQVINTLQSRISAQPFLKAYNHIRDQINKLRAVRREAQKQSAVAQPQAFYARKIDRNLKKKQRQKRKIQDFKTGKALPTGSSNFKRQKRS
jgi:hypothetical protein